MVVPVFSLMNDQKWCSSHWHTDWPQLEVRRREVAYPGGFALFGGTPC